MGGVFGGVYVGMSMWGCLSVGCVYVGVSVCGVCLCRGVCLWGCLSVGCVYVVVPVCGGACLWVGVCVCLALYDANHSTPSGQLHNNVPDRSLHSLQ